MHASLYLSLLCIDVCILSVRSQKLESLIFTFFRRDKKTKLLLIKVSYIAESQIELYLVTSKFTVIGVLNFKDFTVIMKSFT